MVAPRRTRISRHRPGPAPRRRAAAWPPARPPLFLESSQPAFSSPATSATAPSNAWPPRSARAGGPLSTSTSAPSADSTRRRAPQPTRAAWRLRSASKPRLGIDWLSRAAQSCGGVHATRRRVEDTTLGGTHRTLDKPMTRRRSSHGPSATFRCVRQSLTIRACSRRLRLQGHFCVRPVLIVCCPAPIDVLRLDNEIRLFTRFLYGATGLEPAIYSHRRSTSAGLVWLAAQEYVHETCLGVTNCMLCRSRVDELPVGACFQQA